jgi:hypothetical protein
MAKDAADRHRFSQAVCLVCTPSSSKASQGQPGMWAYTRRLDDLRHSIHNTVGQDTGSTPESSDPRFPLRALGTMHWGSASGIYGSSDNSASAVLVGPTGRELARPEGGIRIWILVAKVADYLKRSRRSASMIFTLHKINLPVVLQATKPNT